MRLPGVHAPHRKNTAGMKPVRMPLPAELTIPMAQNIGAPAKPVVKARAQVKVGQLIAEAGGYVSAPIHSPVSGKVKKIDEIISSSGRTDTVIIIEPDGKQEVFEELTPPEITDKKSFVDAVRACGSIGMGGAGFPTSVKLDVDPDRVAAIVVNGAECEPYITSDTRTMIDDAEWLIEGAKLLISLYHPEKFVVGIEDNKPECIKILSDLGKDIENFEVQALPAYYPQGGEKVLIFHTTGRVVEEGKLPIDAGAIVINCTTLTTIAKYVKTGMPLIEKVVTVDGSAVENPQNLIVPIGTKMKDLLDFCGVKSEPSKVMYGGPMMGIAVPTLDSPVLKTTNAVVAFDARDAILKDPTPCIRCGRCITHCPFHLMPASIESAYKAKDGAALKKLKVNICMECGCCAFGCPANRPLVQTNKLSKVLLNKYNAELKLEEEKKKALEAEKEVSANV